jgi:hypothetical protein
VKTPARPALALAACLLPFSLVAVAAHAQSAQPSEPPAPAQASTSTGHTDAASSAASSASSSDAAPKLTLRPIPTWTVQVEPIMWYAGPAGDVRLPGSSGTGPGAPGGANSDEVDLADLNLDSTQISPAGALHINAERWRFSFSGANYSSDQTTTANSAFRIGSVDVSPNDALRTKYDQTTVQLTAGYMIWSRDFAAASEKPENAVPLVLRVYGFGGGRLYDLDISVASVSGGGESGTEQFYAELIAGGRAEMEIADDFSINLEISGGGMGDSDRSIASFDINVNFQWRPIENVGVEIGWRQLAYWMSDGDGSQEFSLNGETAGVYAGVVVRF